MDSEWGNREREREGGRIGACFDRVEIILGRTVLSKTCVLTFHADVTAALESHRAAELQSSIVHLAALDIPQSQ